MRLVDIVHRETGIDFEQIMLLRHSNAKMKMVRQAGATVEDYTFEQPIGSEYDYWRTGKTRIAVLVVIVNDEVYRVYRVTEVERQGTNYSLASTSFRKFLTLNKSSEVLSRRFKMDECPSAAQGERVKGWTAPRTATLRYHPDHSRLFWRIEVNTSTIAKSRAEDIKTDSEMVAAARKNRLRFGNVPTSNREAVARQRVGQDVIRQCCLELYSRRCALCDVADEGLLRASHIVGWADCQESRGDLSNVICLCGSHDVLFENGYWSLGDKYELLIRREINSNTIRRLLDSNFVFRPPIRYPPGLAFIRHHRAKHRLLSSRE